MISPISSSPSTYATGATQSAPPPAPAKTSAPQDTVQLSEAAQAALSGGGDPDHDGD